MAFITDPDSLSNVEVSVNVNTREFTLNAAGQLATGGTTAADNGATGQALYSYFKEEWRLCTEYDGGSSPDFLIKHPFPILPLTREQYEFGNNGSQFNGWRPADATTRNFLRTCGWAEYDETGALLREYAGVITLGGPNTADQVYYENVVGSPVDFNYPGPVNEAVQIYGDIANGNFTRKTIFNVFVRELGFIFNSSSIGDIGVTTMENIVNRFPLATAADANYDKDADFNIGNAPWNAMTITYFEGLNKGTWAITTYVANDIVQSSTDGRWYQTAAGGTSAGDDTDLAGGSDTGVTWALYTNEQVIDGVYYSFHVDVAGNGADRYDIYSFLQYSQTLNSDIDANTLGIIGKTSQQLAYFDGATLVTNYIDETAQVAGVIGGTYISNFNANDKNDIKFTDDLQAIIAYNYVAAGLFDFNVNLETDANAKYWAYFDYTYSESSTDLDVSSSTGANCTITANNGMDFSNLIAGDQIKFTGFATTGNNGTYQVVTATDASNIDVTKIRDPDGVTVTNPADETTVSANIFYNPFGTTSALLIQDSTAADITGAANVDTVSWDFAYDGNTQGGRTAGTTANCVAVAIGLGTAQYIRQPFTITRSTGINVALNSNRERVYST